MRDLSQMLASHPEDLHRGVQFTGHRPGDGLYLHHRHPDDSGEEIQDTQSYDWVDPFG